jgi:hypothetical protein
MVRSLNILIPTYSRPAALAATLVSLCAQTYADFDVIISDQTESGNSLLAAEVQTVIRVLVLHGHQVFTRKHLPRRGIAEHRQFLLEESNGPYVLYLDDDLILEPDVISRLMKAMSEERCGFVGSAPIGLSYIDEERPHQQMIELWEGPVMPERVAPDSPHWQRHLLHNAANILHVQRKLDLKREKQRKYHVAWIGACVLYDVNKLTESGGFRFWKDIPAHSCGEDVLAQTRVMERFGGCGIIPSGVFHQELPTSIPDRSTNALQLAMDRKNDASDMSIMTEVSIGELMDKITILEIKLRKINDEKKLVNIREELQQLAAVRDRTIARTDALDTLSAQLYEVNSSLWRVEDELRECERKKDFGPVFISLARSVYQHNDRRAAIKRSINALTGSRLVEEKSYVDYQAA